MKLINLILFFIIMIVLVFIVPTDDESPSANTNVHYAISDKVFPKLWSYLAVLITNFSTIGTMEALILQFSRSICSVARVKMLHPRCEIIHLEGQTISLP